MIVYNDKLWFVLVFRDFWRARIKKPSSISESRTEKDEKDRDEGQNFGHPSWNWGSSCTSLCISAAAWCVHIVPWKSNCRWYGLMLPLPHAPWPAWPDPSARGMAGAAWSPITSGAGATVFTWCSLSPSRPGGGATTHAPPKLPAWCGAGQRGSSNSYSWMDQDLS